MYFFTSLFEPLPYGASSLLVHVTLHYGHTACNLIFFTKTFYRHDLIELDLTLYLLPMPMPIVMGLGSTMRPLRWACHILNYK